MGVHFRGKELMHLQKLFLHQKHHMQSPFFSDVQELAK